MESMPAVPAEPTSKPPAPPTPTVTEAAVRELFRLREKRRRLKNAEKRLASSALAYDAHRRQLTLLLLGHIPLVLLILLLAAIGGHVHTVQTVIYVYSSLFASFVFALVVFGVQTRRAWLPRAFGLALFGIGLWSTIAVLYAIFTQIRMRAWYDITLAVLQCIDLVFSLAYFYTADMLAGIGGDASAIVGRMHHSGVMMSPFAANIGDAAAVNRRRTRPSVLTTIWAAINGARGQHIKSS